MDKNIVHIVFFDAQRGWVRDTLEVGDAEAEPEPEAEPIYVSE